MDGYAKSYRLNPVSQMIFSHAYKYCQLHERAGDSQTLTDIMKSQRASASKPGLELQILCPCLLGNSAVFKISVKALFKLRRL